MDNDRFHIYLENKGKPVSKMFPIVHSVNVELMSGELTMKKIMLCCSAGMSTSLLVRKMEASASERGIEAEIKAFSASEFTNEVGNYQVVLLGPQVKYMKKDLQKEADKYGIKVETINMMDYGMQNGEKVLDFALELID
jgi:PTS system cellobiose-specific IIB component